MITVNVEEQDVTVECVKKTYEVGTPVAGPRGKRGKPGPPGEPGPPNTLTIGTVDTGEAAATITGQTPNQVLSLSVPPGRDGEPGPPNELSIGTVSTGDAGATITGDTPNQVLNLTIPKGQDGEPGQPNTLTIGTVQQGAAGATITGTSPNQVLNLTLPRGDKGDTGNPTEFELRGTGSPQGVIAAPPGTYYTDVAGTTGAWRWIKASGTGTTGWVVLYGDTGWRNVTNTFNLTSFPTALVSLTRIGSTVIGNIVFGGAQAKTSHQSIGAWPAGFTPRANEGRDKTAIVGESGIDVLLAGLINPHPAGLYLRHNGGCPAGSSAAFRFETSDQWPAILPGTPA